MMCFESEADRWLLPTGSMDYVDTSDLRITGVMVRYYAACKTELWYFASHMSYNGEDENIKMDIFATSIFKTSINAMIIANTKS